VTQLVSEQYDNVSAFWMELSWFNSKIVTFQASRKNFSNTRWIVVGISDTLISSSNHLQTDSWTVIRTEDCSEYLLTLSKCHTNMMNLF